LRNAPAPYHRVFIARSDPALNYGSVAATLLALVALDQIERLAEASETPIYPIIGVGAVPFRGGFRPQTVERCMSTYRSVQTLTVQSAFKYDSPPEVVAVAIAKVKATPRTAPRAIAGDARVLALIERSAARYEAEVRTLAAQAMTLASHVPLRRKRKLHIGLFGYSRSNGPVTLPRAIGFCAGLYSIGLPPEVIGLAGLDDRDWALLDEVVPGHRDELADALQFLDLDVLSLVDPLVQESARAALRRVDRAVLPSEPHNDLTRRLRSGLVSGSTQETTELMVRASAYRGFLG